MNSIELSGCTPEPLMNYLKALGVFRLVAEDRDHGDPAARLSWSGGVAVLHTVLDRDSLVNFFLNDYQPTPIVAPWNGGSGFYGGGSEPLEAIAESSSPRLRRYRETILALKPLIPGQKPKDEDKSRLLIECRNELSDEVGGWLDSCFVLREEGTSFFPLLGTGGNDGRLDFTNNFFQRLADIIGFAAESSPPRLSEDFLRAALFADTIVTLGKSAIGQFNPGGIGGANGTQGRFEADSRVNPWEYVLMLEGILLFAGSVSRRLGSTGMLKAAFPFTVESVAVGYGSAIANEETTDGSRAELWLPLWDSQTSLGEVKQLFAEGRAQLSRRQARNAIEFALAVNLLGVNRGITAFARYGFLKRNGLAFLATPLGRILVNPRPKAQLLQDSQLTEWIDQLRRACRDKDKVPTRYQSALRNIDRAMFEFANRSESGNDEPYLLGVLRALGRAERTLATGLRFAEEKYIPPLTGLSLDWLLLAQPTDDWRQFRLAAALASIGSVTHTDLGPFRCHIEPVEVKGSRVNWSPGSVSAVWSNRGLTANLADALLRRGIEAEQNSQAGVPLRSRAPAPLADVFNFLGNDREGDDELTDLLFALVGLEWSNSEWFKNLQNVQELKAAWSVPDPVFVPIEFSAIRTITEPTDLITSKGRWSVAGGLDEPATVWLKPDLRAHHTLIRASGNTNSLKNAVAMAGRRLHSDRFANCFGPRRQLQADTKLDGPRLAAACLFPLTLKSRTRLVRELSESGSSDE